MYIAGKFYKGPYKDNAADLIAGRHCCGYRVSWEAAIGRHDAGLCSSPIRRRGAATTVSTRRSCRGILFCSHPIANENPRLIDIAPTVLSMFGVTVPEYMDGKALDLGDSAKKPRGLREDALAEALS